MVKIKWTNIHTFSHWFSNTKLNYQAFPSNHYSSLSLILFRDTENQARCRIIFRSRPKNGPKEHKSNGGTVPWQYIIWILLNWTSNNSTKCKESRTTTKIKNNNNIRNNTCNRQIANINKHDGRWMHKRMVSFDAARWHIASLETTIYKFFVYY